MSPAYTCGVPASGAALVTSDDGSRTSGGHTRTFSWKNAAVNAASVERQVSERAPSASTGWI